MSTQLDFKISSGLKNIIGKELITNDRIAIFELVKNSHDANATSVKIVFQNIKTTIPNKPSRILIVDNGDGMSFDDLSKKWLFVGYSAKKEMPANTNQAAPTNFRDKIKKRIFAGAKGVGRFSCDRLGAKLRLYSKKEDENIIHLIDVDWANFEVDQKKEFQTIKVQYSGIKTITIDDYAVKDFKKGTILEISHLNGKWDRDKLIELRNYLQRLINPSQLQNEEEFNIFLEAKEFDSEDKASKKEEHKIINGLIKNIVFEKLNIKTTQVICKISESKVFMELVDKGNFIFSIDEKNEYPELKDIVIQVFYLNPSAKNSFTRIMGMEPKNYGSIFLYKNNFRIHPYGDEGDDWLGLEQRKTQGYARFLSSRELMGRIEIHGVQKDFTEVSSRDGGVIKTEAYHELIDAFIEKVLRRLERYVIEGIDWDKENEEERKSEYDIKKDSIELIQKLAGQVKDPNKNIKFNPNLLKIFKNKQVEMMPEIIKNVETIKKYVKNPEEKDYIDRQLKSVRIATRSLQHEKEEKERALVAKERESLFLNKIISTDKDIIINLNHTIENSTRTINEIIIDINKKIKEQSPIEEIVPFIDELSLENEKVRVLAGIVGLANFNTKVELIESDIVIYVKEYLEKIIRSGVIKFKFLNAGIEYKAKFRPLEISIMLDNFISNARKADATAMTLKFNRNEKNLHILFGDNGKGVDTRVRKFLFTRGYTTTKGSGIGLHHVKSIVESMKGNIQFAGNNYEGLGKGACFEVILR